MNRRLFLTLALAGCSLSSSASADTLQPSDLLGATGDANFIAWLNDYYPRALAAGVPESVLRHELAAIAPDPRVTARDGDQPEFARPISSYIQGVVSADRIKLGRQKRADLPFFPKLEDTYGVPSDILIAIWAMESGFGAIQGNFDVITALATLAAGGRRRPWAEEQLTDCLKIIASGAATRTELKGSWAGAMGQTQLLPSAFLSSAVDADGSGKRDIWGSPDDALASAANLLVKGGWLRGEGWAFEVILPPHFDYGLTEGPKDPAPAWSSRGVKRATGDWSMVDAAAPAQLVLPTGADGPAFLLLPNHFAIRQYNNSIAYALGVGLLADRLGGAPPLATPWPHEAPLSLTDRIAAQRALMKLGYNPGTPDGVIGLGTRQALRAWQKARGLTPDGYLSPAMIEQLQIAAA